MNTTPSALTPCPAERQPSEREPRDDRRPLLPEGAPRGRWFSFVGAGALVAVGYMDPGNWATALGSGAKYGYQLLSVVLVASLMGMLLQWVASRVGVVTGRDLARLCRERFSRRTTVFLWITCEIAIIACDVAEVVGSAVALQLLLGVSLTAGVLMSAIGTFAMLALQSRGKRPLQMFITALIFFIGFCFVVELALARPVWHEALAGLAPPKELLRDAGMIWLAAGILGATVMPHNLYLHSALVKDHAPARRRPFHRRSALRRQHRYLRVARARVHRQCVAADRRGGRVSRERPRRCRGSRRRAPADRAARRQPVGRASSSPPRCSRAG